MMQLRHSPFRLPLGVVLALAVMVTAVAAQTQVTTPMQQFGVNIGDDYHLITYTQLMDYWGKLDRESPRIVVEEIGRTAEDRPELMAIITSPENHRIAQLHSMKSFITIWNPRKKTSNWPPTSIAHLRAIIRLVCLVNLWRRSKMIPAQQLASSEVG